MSHGGNSHTKAIAPDSNMYCVSCDCPLLSPTAAMRHHGKASCTRILYPLIHYGQFQQWTGCMPVPFVWIDLFSAQSAVYSCFPPPPETSEFKHWAVQTAVYCTTHKSHVKKTGKSNLPHHKQESSLPAAEPLHVTTAY